MQEIIDAMTTFEVIAITIVVTVVVNVFVIRFIQGATK